MYRRWLLALPLFLLIFGFSPKPATIGTHQPPGVIGPTGLALTGWGVGDNGVILSTTDGGVSWSLQASGATKNLNSVHFVSAQRSWAVGDSGTILATTDGGNTWHTQANPLDVDLNEVFFRDRWVGWIAGDNGVILRTNTGGEEGPPDALPSVKAQREIVLDGILDEWTAFPEVYLDYGTAATISGVLPTPQDSSGMVFSAWDENYLYLAARLYDDVAFTDSDTLWWDDSVILGIDGLHDHVGWQSDDHAYVVRSDAALGDFSERVDCQNEIAATQVLTDGWSLEVAIPWSKVQVSPAAGSILGFTWAIHDDDNGERWDSFLLWKGTSSSDSHDPNWGHLWLVGDGAQMPRSAPVRTFQTSPVMDGNLAEWTAPPSAGLAFDMARFVYGQIPSTNDLYGQLWAGMDSRYLYFAARVVDDGVVQDSVEIWRDDALEIGLDGNHDHAGGGPYDHHIVFGADGRIAHNDASPLGFVYATQRTANGYQLEIGIPWSELVDAPIQKNQTMGFTFGLRDDDDGGNWDSFLVWEGVTIDADYRNFGHLVFLCPAPIAIEPTPTLSPTLTPSPTSSPSATPSATPTPTLTVPPTATRTPTPTVVPSSTVAPWPWWPWPNAFLPVVSKGFIIPSPTPTPSVTATETPTRTGTPTPSPTRTPTHTHSYTPTATPTCTFTSTSTKTCTATRTRTPTPTRTRTPTPTRTRTPTATPNIVCYNDDFSNPASGWIRGDWDYARFAYTNGEYQIVVKYTNIEVASQWIKPVPDFAARVDARYLGSAVALYGIRFGWSERGFYEYVVFENLYAVSRCDYTIERRCNWVTIKSPTVSPWINLPPSTNQLMVDRVGSAMRVYANNHLLGVYYDARYTGYGAVGLVAGSFTQAPTDVRFDNFVICYVLPGTVQRRTSLIVWPDVQKCSWFQP